MNACTDRQNEISTELSQHLVQPILHAESKLWRFEDGQCPALILQNICLDLEHAHNGQKSIFFTLKYQQVSNRCLITNGTFIAHCEDLTVWDSRSLDLDRPSLCFCANLQQEVVDQAEDSAFIKLQRLTARMPSSVSWVLPKRTGKYGNFEEESSEFCFGLQAQSCLIYAFCLI